MDRDLDRSVIPTTSNMQAPASKIFDKVDNVMGEMYCQNNSNGNMKIETEENVCGKSIALKNFAEEHFGIAKGANKTFSNSSSKQRKHTPMIMPTPMSRKTTKTAKIQSISEGETDLSGSESSIHFPKLRYLESDDEEFVHTKESYSYDENKNTSNKIPKEKVSFHKIGNLRTETEDQAKSADSTYIKGKQRNNIEIMRDSKKMKSSVASHSNNEIDERKPSFLNLSLRKTEQRKSIIEHIQIPVVKLMHHEFERWPRTDEIEKKSFVILDEPIELEKSVQLKKRKDSRKTTQTFPPNVVQNPFPTLLLEPEVVFKCLFSCLLMCEWKIIFLRWLRWNFICYLDSSVYLIVSFHHDLYV